MKRPHRRLHLLTWLLLAPVILISAIYALSQRPETPLENNLPAPLATTEAG